MPRVAIDVCPTGGWGAGARLAVVNMHHIASASSKLQEDMKGQSALGCVPLPHDRRGQHGVGHDMSHRGPNALARLARRSASSWVVAAWPGVGVWCPCRCAARRAMAMAWPGGRNSGQLQLRASRVFPQRFSRNGLAQMLRHPPPEHIVMSHGLARRSDAKRLCVKSCGRWAPSGLPGDSCSADVWVPWSTCAVPAPHAPLDLGDRYRRSLRGHPPLAGWTRCMFKAANNLPAVFRASSDRQRHFFFWPITPLFCPITPLFCPGKFPRLRDRQILFRVPPRLGATGETLAMRTPRPNPGIGAGSANPPLFFRGSRMAVPAALLDPVAMTGIAMWCALCGWSRLGHRASSSASSPMYTWRVVRTLGAGPFVKGGA